MVPRPLPAATSSTCCTRLTIFYGITYHGKWTWNQVPCSASPLAHYYACLWRPSYPTPRLLLHFLVTLAHDTGLFRAQLPLPLLPWTRISSCPHHSVWVPSFTICAKNQFRHATNLGLCGPAYILRPFTWSARTNEHRPALELPTNMEPLATTHARNRV